MMMRSKSYLSALVLLATLGGCQKGAEADKGAAKAAGGDVLPGSVSDAMIDLDGATGTPPLQPPPKAKADSAAADPAKPDASASPDTGGDAATPAAAPSPAAAATQ